jgi:hypothetical protein
MKIHDHWDVSECSCNLQISMNDPLLIFDKLADLHRDFVSIQSHVESLIQSLESEQKIKDGATGMGYNILQEDAAAKQWHIRQLKKLLGINNENI